MSKPKKVVLPPRVTAEDIEWSDEALLDGDEHCQGCQGELRAGEAITPINQCSYVHLKCVHDWFHGEDGGKAHGFTLRKKARK